MFQKRIILIFFIILSFFGGALPAAAALDYNIKNDTSSFLFVSGTSGNVGIATTAPVGKLEVRGGAAASSRIVNINGSFADLAGTRTGLYVDVTAPVVGAFGATGSWSQVRTTAAAGTYSSAISGAYTEAMHEGASTVSSLMGLMTLANQLNNGPVTYAYGIYPQIWKGTGTISNAYGMYFQGVPTANGDTGLTTGVLVNQYGLGIGHLTTGTTRNIALLLDDDTLGSLTAGDFGILQEDTAPNSFAGNIGVGTTAVDAQLTLHSTGDALIDKHWNEDTTASAANESQYYVGKTGSNRATPGDVQKFRFYAGYGAFQEVGQIAVNTPTVTGGNMIGAVDFKTQGADGVLTPRMTVNEQGVLFPQNVGVGTTTPVSALQVGINPGIPAGSSPVTAIKGNLVVDGKIYGDGSGLTGISGAITGLTATRVPVASGSATIVDSSIYDVGGNIGIGTAIPGEKLDIYSTSNTTLKVASYFDVSSAVLFLKGSLNSAGWKLVAQGSSNVNGNNDLAFKASDVTRVLFSDEGNVGIGTISPELKLDVRGGYVQARFSGSGTNGRGLFLGNVTDGYGDYISSDSRYRSGGSWQSKSTVGSGIRFLDGDTYFINDSALTIDTDYFPTTRLFVGRTGNVGMGTAGPVAKLDLVGSGTTSATSALVIRDSNTSAMVTVLDNGNVGIGTTTPVGKLNVRNDGTSAVLTYWSSDLGTNDRYLRLSSPSTDSTSQPFRFETQNSLAFEIDNSEAMRIDYERNVGIGTTAPLAKLQVGSGTPNAMSITGNDLYVKGNIELDGKIYGDGSGLTGVSGAITGLTATRMPVASGSTMIVDSSVYDVGGNIGIGSSGPVARLDVAGAAASGNILRVSMPAGYSGNAFFLADSTGAEKFSVLSNGNVVSMNNFVGYGFIDPSTNQQRFKVDNTTAYIQTAAQTRMMILNDGNIGIGTTAPVANLHIGGAGAVPNAMSITGSDLYVKGNIELDGKIYGDGSGLTGISGAITGLTATRVPVASGSTTIVDSSIYDVSGNVGIGTTAPNNTIQVAGLIDFNNTDLNTRLGYQSGKNIVSGAAENTFVGYQAGASAAAGGTNAADGNTAMGYLAFFSNTTGSGNSAFGRRSLYWNTGDDNTALGLQSLLANTTGGGSTAIGVNSLYSKATGGNNIALGMQAGRWIADGSTGLTIASNGVFLGADSKALADSSTNEIVIGYNATGLGSNTAILGNTSITKTALRGNVGIGTTAPLAKLAVVGTGATTARAFEIDDNLYNPKVVVLDNGNVGIGTVAPVASLHVGAEVPQNFYSSGDVDAYGQVTSVKFTDTGTDNDTISNYTSTLIDATVNSAERHQGVVSLMATPASLAFDVPSITAFEGFVKPAASSTLGTVYVYESYVEPQAGAGNITYIGGYDAYIYTYPGYTQTISDYTAFNAWLDLEGGTVTAAYGLYVGTSTAGTGNIANAYGVYLEALGGVTKSYGIYQLGATDLNYFAGNVGIGTTVPLAKLDLVGAGTTSATSSLVIRDSNKVAKVTVLDNGNVGIGTTNPLSNFVVKSGAGSASVAMGAQPGDPNFAVIYLNGNQTASGYNLGANTNGNLRINRPTGGSINFTENDSTPAVTLLSGGNVGIGTTAPVAKLHIGDAGTVPGMPITGNDAYVKGNLEVDGKIYGDGSGLTGISGAISGLTATRLPLASSSTTLVDSSIYEVGGNIGIGTTAPGSLLNVVGGNVWIGTTSAGGQSAAPLAVYGGTGLGTQTGVAAFRRDDAPANANTIGYLASFQRINSTTAAWYMGAVTGTNAGILASNNADMRIGADHSGTFYDVMTMKWDGTTNIGNIGIGTTAPVARIDLVGAGTTSATSALIIRDSARAAKITVLDNGNVGVGLTTPYTTLDVYNPSGGFVRGLKLANNPSSDEDGVYMQFNTAGDPNSNDNYGPYVGSRRVIGGSGHLVFGTNLAPAPNSVLERMRITNAGNVGIGTTLPPAVLAVGVGQPNAMPITGSDLYVKGNIELDGKIYGDGSALTGISGAITGLTATRVPVASGSMTIVDSVIYSVGNNVGIGTTAPVGTLHLWGSGALGSNAAIYFGDRGTATNPYIKEYGTGDSDQLELSATSGVLITDGNLGIGTTVPGALLQIVGTTNDVEDLFKLSNTASENILSIRGQTTGTDYASFYVKDSRVMVMNENGNVGLGTTAPNSKLQLGGSFAVYRTATAASVSSAGETIIGVTSTAAERTITLATADCVVGRVVIIKDESGAAGTNNITIATEGAQAIDGTTDDVSLKITANYGVVRVYSNGTNWFTF